MTSHISFALPETKRHRKFNLKTDAEREAPIWRRYGEHFHVQTEIKQNDRTSVDGH